MNTSDPELERMLWLERQNQAYNDGKAASDARQKRVQEKIDAGDFIGAELECWTD